MFMRTPDYTTKSLQLRNARYQKKQDQEYLKMISKLTSSEHYQPKQQQIKQSAEMPPGISSYNPQLKIEESSPHYFKGNTNLPKLLTVATLGILFFPAAAALKIKDFDRSKSDDAHRIFKTETLRFDSEVSPEIARGKDRDKISHSVSGRSSSSQSRSEQASTQALSPQQQAKRDFIQNELSSRLDSSSKAKNWYRENLSQKIEKNLKSLKKAIKRLANDDEIYCKLKSIFENPTFKFVICAEDELGRTTPAIYNPPSNTIRLKITALKSSALLSVLRHEIHHAFVRFQNIKMNRLFYMADTEKWQYSSLPCEPSGKTVDCQILDFINPGFKRIEGLLKILDEGPSNAAEKELLNRYLNASKNYKSVALEATLSESKIKALQAKGLIDESLEIIDPMGELFEAGQETNGIKRYIISIERRNGQYIAKSLTTSEKSWPHKQTVLKAPLLDVACYCSAYKDENPADKIKEHDAVIHQYLEPYPELYDLLFPGLREFHQQRSDESYQQCINGLRA